MSLFFPLTKIDEAARTIHVRVAEEIADKANEILDYATGRPAFETWSNDTFSRSNGLSKGNVRAMHSRHASGVVRDLFFDDDAKAIDATIEVVDPVDWEKCLKGVYTGVSIGGGYAKRWQDGGLIRYTPRINEISLVDDPCIPTARITQLAKMNGETVELRLTGRPRMFSEVYVPPAKTCLLYTSDAADE